MSEKHPDAFSTELRILRKRGTSTEPGRLQYRVRRAEFGTTSGVVYFVHSNNEWSEWMDVPVAVEDDA